MNPNVLLAASTLLATALLVANATLFGGLQPWWRLIALAIIVAAATALLEPWMNKRIGRPPDPMIVSGGNLGLAAVLPLVVMTLAILPAIFRGVDFGLAVIIGAVLSGSTLTSARRSLRRP